MQNRCMEWADLINALIECFIVFSEPYIFDSVHGYIICKHILILCIMMSRLMISAVNIYRPG